MPQRRAGCEGYTAFKGITHKGGCRRKRLATRGRRCKRGAWKAKETSCRTAFPLHSGRQSTKKGRVGQMSVLMVDSQVSPTPHPIRRMNTTMASQTAIQRRTCLKWGRPGVVLFVMAVSNKRRLARGLSFGKRQLRNLFHLHSLTIKDRWYEFNKHFFVLLSAPGLRRARQKENTGKSRDFSSLKSTASILIIRPFADIESV